VGLSPKPHSCCGCPAYTQGKGYVPGTGPLSATMAIIGQGPGQDEAYAGEPFIGLSGQRLNRWLATARVPRSHLYIDNAIRCWMLRPGTLQEAAYCALAHLLPSLQERSHLRVVVPVGVPAMRTFLGKKAGERLAGGLLTTDLQGVHQWAVTVLHKAGVAAPMDATTSLVSPAAPPTE